MPQVPLEFSDAPEASSDAPAARSPISAGGAPSVAPAMPSAAAPSMSESSIAESSTSGERTGSAPLASPAAGSGSSFEVTHSAAGNADLTDADGLEGTDEAPDIPVLDRPADGVPAVIEDERALVAAAQALRAGTGPAGFVLAERDAILAVGALVASELYAVACPIVAAPDDGWASLADAARVSIEAGPAGAVIRIEA